MTRLPRSYPIATRHAVARWALLAVLILVGTATCNHCRGMASAQKRIVVPADLAVALAQTCESECIGDHWECAAILQALRARAAHRDQSVRDVLRAHSDGVFDRARTDHRAWIAWLRADGSKPRHWPRYRYGDPARGKHPAWGSKRRRWLRLVSHCRYLLAHDVRVCAQPALTWGNAEDRARYVRQNPQAVEVDCGATRNHFMRPSAAKGDV